MSTNSYSTLFLYLLQAFVLGTVITLAVIGIVAMMGYGYCVIIPFGLYTFMISVITSILNTIFTLQAEWDMRNI